MDPLLDRAMALAKIGAWSCNLADNRLSWSTGVYDLFGLSVRTALDRRQTVEMYTEESREALERLRTQTIAKRGTFTLDAQIARATGDKRWMRITGEVTDDKHGTPHLHGLKQDITEEKSRSEELRRLAENDTLTGLASRAVYEDRFLNRHRLTSSVMRLGALILFDLDGFKSINDRLGHAAGDACLRVFAERLSANFPKALLIARIGGDEFAVIVGDEEPKLLIEAHVARFLTRLRAPILWREHMFTIAATSGLAIPSDPHSYDAEELFVSADLALYDAKRRFRSTPTLCHL
jgi:diguanylate cyclase (GGDEF)-like protein/PAS domain S-box-containing protein